MVAASSPDDAPRVTPIGIPSRADLFYRVQLAKSVLNHRPLDEDTAALLLRILDGESIGDLNHPQRGRRP